MTDIYALPDKSLDTVTASLLLLSQLSRAECRGSSRQFMGSVALLAVPNEPARGLATFNTMPTHQLPWRGRMTAARLLMKLEACVSSVQLVTEPQLLHTLFVSKRMNDLC